MADNDTNGQETSTGGDPRRQAASTSQSDGGFETARATESATGSARETMNEGSESVDTGSEGVADTGRDPEYYAEKRMP